MTVEPYYENREFGVTLYCGDALAVLPRLESGSVEAVVTDPPYGTKTHQRDEWMVGEFGNIMPLALPLIRDTMTSDGAFYCFTSWSMMADWLIRYQQYFKLQNILVWDKERHSGCYSPNSWQFTWEGIFFGLKGSRRIREYLPDVLTSAERGKRLPMQKPVDVLEAMLRASTDEEQLVLDPFLGSGSTGVACVNTGRRFIGIELNADYCRIAQERIEKAITDRQKPKQREFAETA